MEDTPSANTSKIRRWQVLIIPKKKKKYLGETHMEALENCGGITSVGVICQFSKTPSQLGWRNQTSVDTPQEDDAQEAVQFLREDSLKLMNSRTLHSF